MLMIFTRSHKKGEKRGFVSRLLRRKPAPEAANDATGAELPQAAE
jgi:hypothetical protein